MKMNIQEALREASKKLKKTSPSPFLDAEILLSYVLKKNREFILTYPEKKLTKAQEEKFEKSLKRRLKNEPVAYILSHKEFYGLDFKVTPDTLIPRPETETLVENALNHLKSKNNNDKKTIIADIGTGSGNIIISVAKEIASSNLPTTHYELIATDISAPALKIAKQNARKNNLGGKIFFSKGNLLEPVIESKKNKFNDKNIIILANLPYLSQKIYSETPRDVKKFEPRSALLGGIDGLARYGKLFTQIKKLKDKFSTLNVLCYAEISPEQKEILKRLVKINFPIAKIEFLKDLAGKWRIAEISL
jgi:release factor glutamine methyltransferase